MSSLTVMRYLKELFSIIFSAHIHRINIALASDNRVARERVFQALIQTTQLFRPGSYSGQLMLMQVVVTLLMIIRPVIQTSKVGNHCICMILVKIHKLHLTWLFHIYLV